MDSVRLFCILALVTVGSCQKDQQANYRVFSMSLSGKFRNFYKSSDMLAMLRTIDHEDCLSRTDFQKHLEGIQALQFFKDQYDMDLLDVPRRYLYEGSVKRNGLELRRLLWPHTAKYKLDGETHRLRMHQLNDTHVTMAQWRVTVLKNRHVSKANYSGVLTKGNYVAVGEYCFKTPGGFADKVSARFHTVKPVETQRNGKAIIEMEVTGSQVKDRNITPLGHGTGKETQIWRKKTGKITGVTTIIFP